MVSTPLLPRLLPGCPRLETLDLQHWQLPQHTVDELRGGGPLRVLACTQSCSICGVRQ